MHCIGSTWTVGDNSLCFACYNGGFTFVFWGRYAAFFGKHLCRGFFGQLYPQYNKAIYLDSDIVVLGDIAELYNQDLGDNLIAAAPDDVIQTTKVFQEYAEKVVGVADYRNYFNAGILLMNLDEFRRFDFQNDAFTNKKNL